MDSVSIDQPNGRVVLTVKAGPIVDLHEVTDAIVGSFTPREINVTLTGRIENWNGRLTLVVNETARFFLKEEGQSLETAIGTTRLVTIAGVAALEDDHREHPYTITIKRIGAPQ